MRYNTIEKYRILIKKYIKPFLGQYRLSSISSVKLTTYINELCEKYDFSRAYFRSILKVLKGSFRDAVNIYGFIRLNPALTIRLPKLIKENEEPKHLYSQNEIEMILDRFKDDDVFTKHDGKYTGKDVIKYPYTVIHKELGIKNCRFYDLRGSYATNILRSGAELKDVADLLGHKNIETTENYYIRATNNGKEHANKLIEKNLEPEVIAKYIRFAYN